MEKPKLDIANLIGIPYPKVGTSKLPRKEGKGFDQVIGIEIEVENVSHDDDWYREELGNNFNVTIDNSLRGDAYEFITTPLPIGIALAELERFYKVTEFGPNNFSDRCSIHVHANVTDMTQDQVASVCLLYQSVEDILFQFVGADRDTNLYCIPWSQCRMNHRLIEKIFNNPVGKLKDWQKYTALNLLPILRQGTVEFRHMHGTSDLSKITKWLSIIGSLFNYSKSSTYEDVVSVITDLNSSSHYQAFFDTVFGGILPYNDKYQQMLSQGILNAKYSLMDFDYKIKQGIPSKEKINFNVGDAIFGDLDVAPTPTPPGFTTRPFRVTEQLRGQINQRDIVREIDAQADTLRAFAVRHGGEVPWPAPFIVRPTPRVRPQEVAGRLQRPQEVNVATTPGTLRDPLDGLPPPPIARRQTTNRF